MQINSINNANFGKYMVSQEAHSIIDCTPHENIVYDSKLMLECVKDELNAQGDTVCLTIGKDNLNITLNDTDGPKGFTTFHNVEEYADYPFEILSSAFTRFISAFGIDLTDILFGIAARYEERNKNEYREDK